MTVVFALGRAGRVGLRRLPAGARAARPASSAPPAAGAVRAAACRHDRRPRRGRRHRGQGRQRPGLRLPGELLELIVASDGSDDGTVEAARRAGRPRCSTCRASASSPRSTGRRRWRRGRSWSSPTPTRCSSPGRCAGSSRTSPTSGSAAWRPTSSASWRRTAGRSPAARGCTGATSASSSASRTGSAASSRPAGTCTRCAGASSAPSTQTAGTDDFLISSQVVKRGRRLAFDERAVVLVATPEEGGTELRRKVRVMNRGLRSALALG